MIASKFDIVFVVQTAFADALSHDAVFELAELDPAMSARQVFTPAQVITFYLWRVGSSPAWRLRRLPR